MSDNTTPRTHTVRLADLATGKPTPFKIEPDAAQMAEISADLSLLGLRKLRFEGELRPQGKSDWQLAAKLGATVTQPCVATLAPVTTRLDEPVSRLYVTDFDMGSDDGGEAEMPEDETIEPKPAALNLYDVMLEALALALPLYPRAEDAGSVDAQLTEPGKEALTDEDVKPFAALKALRDKLDKGD